MFKHANKCKGEGCCVVLGSKHGLWSHQWERGWGYREAAFSAGWWRCCGTVQWGLSLQCTHTERKHRRAGDWRASPQAGRKQNTRLPCKHSNLRQGGKNTGVLATQAKPQSTGAKTERSQDANNHIDWRNDLVTSRRESRGFIEGWLLEWIHLVLPVEGDLAHMHTHRTDMGRDTGGIIQTGKYKTHTHTQGRRQGCHDEIMTGGIRGAEG